MVTVQQYLVLLAHVLCLLTVPIKQLIVRPMESIELLEFGKTSDSVKVNWVWVQEAVLLLPIHICHIFYHWDILANMFAKYNFDCKFICIICLLY